MALYERIIGIGNASKIPVHQLRALLAEVARTRLTLAQAEAALGLTAEDRTELATLRTRMQTDPTLTPDVVEQVAVLAESGMAYTTPAAMRARFGV
jgi:hypothetical protein